MAHHLRLMLFVGAALALVGASDPPPKKKAEKAVELPPLNKKVVDFACVHLGRKVGNGQCTRLAEEALKSAGARRMENSGLDADYVWGREIKSVKEALPGDILQFRDAVFAGRTVTRSRITTWHTEYPHHTAVVSEIRDGGKTLVILHQNIGKAGDSDEKKQIVQRDTIRPESLTRGTVWIYRPLEPGEQP